MDGYRPSEATVAATAFGVRFVNWSPGPDQEFYSWLPPVFLGKYVYDSLLFHETTFSVAATPRELIEIVERVTQRQRCMVPPAARRAFAAAASSAASSATASSSSSHYPTRSTLPVIATRPPATPFTRLFGQNQGLLLVHSLSELSLGSASS